MIKMTSAYANKVLKKLAEDKEFWRRKEVDSCSYIAAADEEPVIPDYDFATVAAEMAAIDEKIVKIKHAININNVTNQIAVGDKQMTVDEILVRMAQLNKRKTILDVMRKVQPKSRLKTGTYYSARKMAPEYEYINYDLNLVKSEYERIDAEIAAMQIALDKYNQTFEFEVQI